MEARCRCGIMRMEDKVSGEESGRQARYQRCGTTGMDTAVEEMQDSNRRDVGQWRLQNGLEERQQTRKTSKGNNYQPEGVLSLQ